MAAAYHQIGNSATAANNWVLKNNDDGTFDLQYGNAGSATTILTLNKTGAITVASGTTLTLGNAATTGLTAGALAALTNASITVKDSVGTTYRIPCIV